MAKNEPQIMLPPITFTPAGDTEELRQAALGAAMQAPSFPDVAILIADAISKRAETIMLDYSREAVVLRYEIDGLWHDLPPRDRQSGDLMLFVLKTFAGLNPQERRARQQGKFRTEFRRVKHKCTLTSQGVPTGERVALQIDGLSDKLDSLESLGMREKMRERFKQLIDATDGMIVISALPKGGLSTTWRVGLTAADRFVREFVAVEDEAQRDDEVINITPKTYNAAAGETPGKMLPKLMLREPEVLVVPNFTDAQSMNALCDLVIDDKKLVVTRVHAKSAPEALLRLLALKGAPDKFAKAVTMVLNQRLLRKLCERCKQPYQPAPQVLQQLGIPAGRVRQLFREWQPPPPEQLVDEKGQPIIPPICPDCGGLGYRGRTAIFEMLVIDDKIRQALIKKPQLETLRQVAREAGNITLREEGILLVAKGATSLSELQRVLKQ